MARALAISAFAVVLAATAAHAALSAALGGASYPPIVGLSFVGRGFDLTTMQPGLLQLTETTYTMGQTWRNPQDGITYAVPDQMFAQTLDKSYLSNTTTAFTGTEDIQVWAQHTSHWHSGLFGIDSHSKTTYNFVERFFQQDQSLAITDVEVQFLELTAPTFPPPVMSNLFKLAVAKLPTTCCTDNWHMFEEFFQAFGTAYMDSAKLGGRLRGRTWYAKCLLNVTSTSWVSEQSSWSVLGIIGGGHGHSSHNDNINGAFKTCNSQDFDYYGGNASHLAPNEYASWVSSTFISPFPVSYTLQPIASLVSDPAQAKVLQQAVDKYLADSQAALEAQIKASQAQDPHIMQQCCKEVKKQQEQEQEEAAAQGKRRV